VTTADPGATPPPVPGERAMRHRTEQTRTYPCSACGGQLEFHAGKQRLRCPHCGNVQDIVEAPPAAGPEHDFATAVAAMKARATTAPSLAGEKEVVCQSCGGHTTFTGTLTATRCPYCATPIQRDDVHAAPDRLPVDGVVPFGVDERQARAALEKWVNSRRFAPSEFKRYRRTGSFASVYAAYFTYDADTVTSYHGQRGDEYKVTVGSGDKQRTETRVRWTPVAGTVANDFDDICVLANDGFDAAKVRALEPWPTQTARPYSAEYVAGHLCRTYDRDVEQCFGEAERRMASEIDSTIRRDIGGDRQQIDAKDTRAHSLTFRHLLLPIWLLTVIYGGRPFQVFINGITGEVQGQRPWSRAKVLAAIAVAVILLAVAFALWGGGGEGGGS
jgi:predicted RNA-binding Zn-ribbon protein involved in translation (DUF1610 family)